MKRFKKPIELKEIGKTVMPIVGFWGPPDGTEHKGKEYPSLKTDEVFALCKEAGVNMFLQGHLYFSRFRILCKPQARPAGYSAGIAACGRPAGPGVGMGSL